jgi:DNA polymerase elongation subunit (family B)
MLRPKFTKPKTLSDNLTLQIIDWVSYDIKVDNTDDYDSDDEEGEYRPKYTKEFIIRGYGVNENGNSVNINVKGFKPYFYIKLPFQEWELIDFKKFLIYIQLKVADYAKDYLLMNQCTIEEKKEFYGFTNNKLFKFGKLVFKNLSGMYAFKKALLNDNQLHKFQNKKFKMQKLMYETKITPLLRFFHVQNIKPVGWVQINKRKYSLSNSISRCNIEINVNYEDVNPLNINKIGRLLVASFDIECTSIDGTFPQADRAGDEVIQIGTSIYEYGSNECLYKHMITLKDCDSIEGVVVESYHSEKEVIMAWAKFIERLDPDIITGYNIWGFDEKYLYERAKTGCGGRYANFSEFFLKRLSRNRNVQPKYEEEGHKLSSSALGDNFLYYYEIEGIVQIDLFKVIQKDYNLESYKLDYVSQHFMKNNKVDLSPKQLFQNYREGTPDKIKEIAVYCIKDCVLVNDLMNKLNVITNNVGMGNVCIVPLSYLFLRGQGIKIYSLVVKQCRDEGFLIKELTKDDIDTNGYEGAIVFVPEPGIYFEPVAVMDYASLYPSSMIAENISHDSIVGYKTFHLQKDGSYECVEDKINYDYYDLDDFNYNQIEYDLFQGIGDDKEKIGYKICTFAEHKDGSKSVLPRILQNLLKARKDTRKTMKYKKVTTKDGKVFSGLYEEDEDNIILKTVEGEKFVIEKSNMESNVDLYNDFEKAVLDGQQLAYKVTCNSVYGQVGASTSPICFKELAASTTATGRKMVITARDITLENYKGSKLVYGDSVVGDEPLLLRDKDGKIEIKTIKSLSNKWEAYENFKPFDTVISNRINKEKSKCDYEVWANDKWNPIKKVIRHKNNKKIFRVNTLNGVVDVTEDHSLLNDKKQKIKPEKCIIGLTKLYTSFPSEIEKLENYDSDIEEVKKFYNKCEAAKYYYYCKYKGFHPQVTYYNNVIKVYINNNNYKFNNNEIINIQYLRICNSGEYVYDLETEDGLFQCGIGEINVKNTDSIFVNFVDYIKQKYGDNLSKKEMLEKTIEVGEEAGALVTSHLKKPQDLEYEKVFYPFIIFSKKRYVGNKYELDPTKFKQTSMGIVLKRRDNAPILKHIYGGIIDTILNKSNIEDAKEYYKNEVQKLLIGDVNIKDLIITKSIKANYANPTTIAHKVLADRMGERDPGNKPQSNDRIPYCFINHKCLKCSICNCNISKDNCKCRKCMKLFCPYHLNSHKKQCKKICRFCKCTEDDCELIDCNTCKGVYCVKYNSDKSLNENCCYYKHNLRNDKYKNVFHDKCKKILDTKLIQGDIIEHPQYIQEKKLLIDYRYYFEKQIRIPVEQIFGLTMAKPEKLTEDILRIDTNKKERNTSITQFFKAVKKNKEKN